MTTSDDTPADNDEQAESHLPQLADFEKAIRTAAKSSSAPGIDQLDATPGLSEAEPDGDTRPDGLPSRDVHLDDRLEELADDQLELMRSMEGLAIAQSALSRRIEELSHAMTQSTTSLSHSINHLRSELVSERRGLALKSIFDSLIEPYERLGAMAKGLAAGVKQDSEEAPAKETDKAADEPDRTAVQNQIQAVVMILQRAVRELGFEEYRPAVGEPFAPERMSCAGYAEGEPGVVLETVKTGYRAGDLVVMPAAVLIADPMSISQEDTSGDDE